MTGWAGDALTFWCCSPRCCVLGSRRAGRGAGRWPAAGVWAGSGPWALGRGGRVRSASGTGLSPEPRSAALCFLVALLPVSATCGNSCRFNITAFDH